MGGYPTERTVELAVQVISGQDNCAVKGDATVEAAGVGVAVVHTQSAESQACATARRSADRSHGDVQAAANAHLSNEVRG